MPALRFVNTVYRVCVWRAGDGAGVGGVRLPGEVSGAAEGGSSGPHEPQCHSTGERWYCRLWCRTVDGGETG